jgi:hypothetical protein
MPRRERRRFTPEYKAEVVALVRSSGNRERRHSVLGNVSPEEFEAAVVASALSTVEALDFSIGMNRTRSPVTNARKPISQLLGRIGWIAPGGPIQVARSSESASLRAAPMMSASMSAWSAGRSSQSPTSAMMSLGRSSGGRPSDRTQTSRAPPWGGTVLSTMPSATCAMTMRVACRRVRGRKLSSAKLPSTTSRSS